MEKNIKTWWHDHTIQNKRAIFIFCANTITAIANTGYYFFLPGNQKAFLGVVALSIFWMALSVWLYDHETYPVEIIASRVIDRFIVHRMFLPPQYWLVIEPLNERINSFDKRFLIPVSETTYKMLGTPGYLTSVRYENKNGHYRALPNL